MTPIEVKYFLSSGYWVAKNAESKRRRIAQLRSWASSSTGRISAQRIGGTTDRSRLDKYVSMAADLQRELDADLAALIASEREITAIINMLDDTRARAILSDYHISRLTQDQIADKYHYSTVQIWRICKKAYEDIAGKLEGQSFASSDTSAGGNALPGELYKGRKTPPQ